MKEILEQIAPVQTLNNPPSPSTTVRQLDLEELARLLAKQQESILRLQEIQMPGNQDNLEGMREVDEVRFRDADLSIPTTEITENEDGSITYKGKAYLPEQDVQDHMNDIISAGAEAPY